jgi:kynureninase
MTTRADCQAMDAADALGHLRKRFILPEGKIYLDGNSLGPMPVTARARMAQVLDVEWSQDLITSWNTHGWFTMPGVLGNKIANLVGGGEGNVVVADTISVNLFKLLTAALALRPDRKVILTDTGNFPSDLYVAQGLRNSLRPDVEVKSVAPEEVASHIDDSVAVVMLTEVDYRSARRHDMAALTALAHAQGCLALWDLSHSAGAVPLDLLGCDADFAMGCTYKYLNGGPGAPAFLFVHPRLQAEAMPALVGWWGHAEPFAFDPTWRAAAGVARFQCGTQGVLSMVALEAALAAWDDVDMPALQNKSQGLCNLFITLVEEHCTRHGLRLSGPRNMAERGSHVSFECPEGYAVMQALIARGVIGDFRAPNLIRFGFAPLYNSFTEVFDAAAMLADILDTQGWNKAEYRARKVVT